MCCPSTKRSKYSNCTVNLGQTRIFYKMDETRLTRTKDDPDDPTQFQPWVLHVNNSLSGHVAVLLLGLTTRYSESW